MTENIHQHLDMGKPKALWRYGMPVRKIAFSQTTDPFLYPGYSRRPLPWAVYRAPFLLLALAIGFSMVFSLFPGADLCAFMANWLMKVKHHKKADGREMTDAEELEQAGLSADGEKDTWEQRAALVSRADSNRDGKISRFEKLRNRYLEGLSTG